MLSSFLCLFEGKNNVFFRKARAFYLFLVLLSREIPFGNGVEYLKYYAAVG